MNISILIGLMLEIAFALFIVIVVIRDADKEKISK